MFDYIIDNYLNGSNQFGFIVADTFTSVLLILLLSRFSRSIESALFMALKCMSGWALFLALQSVYYVLFPNGNYGYIVSVLLYAAAVILLYGRKNVTESIVRALFYCTADIYASSFIALAFLIPLPGDGAAALTVWLRVIMLTALVVYVRLLPLRSTSFPAMFAVLFCLICTAGLFVEIAFIVISDLLGGAVGLTFNLMICNMLICIGLSVIEFVAYYIFRRTVITYEKMLAARTERAKLETENKVLEIALQNDDEIRMIRHDIKNQYAYVDTLLKSGDFAGAIKFFDRLLTDAEKPLGHSRSGNKTVDALVNLASGKASRCGARLVSSLAVPAELPIADTDLAGVLMNLTDNAAEACAMLEESAREIRLDVTVRKKYLLITVANPVDPASDAADALSLKTRKPDAKSHGYGHRIVERAVAKYDGMVRYAVENGVFVAEAMMVMRQSGGNIEKNQNSRS